eukprot:CAMPEP_0172320270 /NCGR_PEP_ID=MMETSP1058-20130122/40152_1 /TAXON_ID=83371 /ORGANISM="Detonula confervacea, Strain CCMP 353" /LENGTH=619 /DNA_ID=CAMNT_0013035499 /DNA_START=39 /DNA_END=1898 /DNA_ORIENTATION=+
MVRLGKNGGGSRGFDDMASYITDTSSITNPVGFGSFYSSEEDDDDEVSFMDSATSALTGLTGWTSANGNGAVSTSRSARSRGSRGFGGTGGVSESGGESENFPMAHSKSYKSSAYSESGYESAISDLESHQVSAISFGMNGSMETSIEGSIGEIEVMTHGSRNYKSKSRKQANTKTPPAVIAPPPGKGVQTPPSISPTSSILSNTSNASKKRAPVPPLRDPNMEDTEEDQMWEEDCNYDINPTLMFLVLESHNWKEAIALLDGKGLENKNDAWNLGSLFGGKRKDQGNANGNPKDQLAKKQQKELQVQARTWITRRERNGVLRWRMLPLHAALAFNAPFDVVLRLYHLYPGAVRCRNDQGMLPLHHVFKYGNEDKILELLLDVFPEALTVVDDKKRLPLGCTPKDGSDNERRSVILTLFANFQLEMATKKEETVSEEPQEDPAKDVTAVTQQKSSQQSLSSIKEVQSPRTPLSPVGEGGTLLGASAPRYSTNTDYNHVTYNSIKPLSSKNASAEAPIVAQQAPKKKNLPLSPKAVGEEDDVSISDRYAMLDVQDSENNPLSGNTGRRALGMGLSTIPENGTLSPKAKSNALKAELLALGEKKKKKGLKKLFGKKRGVQI